MNDLDDHHQRMLSQSSSFPTFAQQSACESRNLLIDTYRTSTFFNHVQFLEAEKYFWISNVTHKSAQNREPVNSHLNGYRLAIYFLPCLETHTNYV